MKDITLSIPAEIVETFFNFIDLILFATACTVKGAAMVWGICFILWVLALVIALPYGLIKSTINNK
jgi:hypothetical protein